MTRFDPMRAAELVRDARRDATLTQVDLARRAGVSQSTLAQIESGRRTVSGEMLERLLRAADYRPSLPLAQAAEAIRERAAVRGLSRVRVFGSVARGTDGFDSDIDLLVEAGEDADLFDLALFGEDVRRLTGFSADVVSDRSSSDALRGARDQAIAL